MQLPPYLSVNSTKEIFFGDKRQPSLSTIRRWLINGALPSRRIGGMLFLDVAAFLAQGNPLVEKIFRHESRTPKT